MERGFDPRIRSPFNMIISGPSQSGKSTFVANLLKYHNRMFKRPPKKIVMLREFVAVAAARQFEAPLWGALYSGVAHRPYR